MAFFFRMTFTGMCAFVPRQLQPGERDQGTVLLVNAVLPVDDLNLHAPLCEHIPTIHYHGVKRLISGMDVSVELGAPTPDSLTLVDDLPNPKPDRPKPNTNDDRDHYWIMDMAALNAGVVDNECFGPTPDARVSSRVKLKAGHLSTSRMVEDQTGKDIPWAFRASETGSPLIERVMAAEFSVTAFVQADQAILVLRPFGSANEERITLSPAAGEVVLAVENLCDLDEIPSNPSEEEPGVRVLPDFGWFYRLAARPVGVPVYPGVIYLPYPSEGSGITDTMCPPARYPEHPDA